MNPYKVLNIDCHATKQEIIRAMAMAMRERRFSSREVAIAQKELLDPISRAAHDFVQFIDVKPLQEQFVITRPEDQHKGSVSALKRLSLFDGDS